jgi:type IV pilus assembly protein PilO
VAELIPKDRRGQTLLFLTFAALAVAYFAWFGTPVIGIPGVAQLGTTRDSLNRKLDSLRVQVNNAQRDVRRGTVAQLERALAEYRATLDLMRQLVPASEEIPNLLDDVSSRAKVRGANVVNFVPQPPEAGTPFDTKRVRVTVTGTYDQIGEFLSDIASMPRIIVPSDLSLQRINSPTADSSLRARGVLQASFQLRTYVKTSTPPAGAATPSGQPARPGARPATPPAARGAR